MKRMMVAVILVVMITVLPVQAQFEFGMAGPEVKQEVALATDAVHADTSFRGAVRFSLSPGWHVNSNKPLEDYLIATALSFKEAPGFTLESVAYPEHSLYTFEFSPDQPLAVYGEKFSIGFAVHADETVVPGDYELNGLLRFQACNESMCAPPRDLEFAIAVKVEDGSVPLKQTAPDWFMQVNWDAASSAVTEISEVASAPEALPSDSNWRELVEKFTVAGRLDGFTNTAGFIEFIKQHLGFINGWIDIVIRPGGDDKHHDGFINFIILHFIYPFAT